MVRKLPFFIGVLRPVCGILLFNLLCFVKVMCTIRRETPGNPTTTTPRDNPNSNNTLRIKRQREAKAAITCTILFGFTWLFGVLAVADLRLVFQILFALCNSLQGLCIFILYTVNNPDVRKELRKIALCWQKNPKKNYRSPLHPNDTGKGNFYYTVLIYIESRNKPNS